MGQGELESASFATRLSNRIVVVNKIEKVPRDFDKS